ncbi:MAG: hypothetical protein ABII22_04125 [Candidatus Micrarchaeota archaeon]
MKKYLLFLLLLGSLVNSALIRVDLSESIVGYAEKEAIKIGEYDFLVFDHINSKLGPGGIQLATSVDVKIYHAQGGVTSLYSSVTLVPGQDIEFRLPSTGALPFPEEAGSGIVTIDRLSVFPAKEIDFTLIAPFVHKCTELVEPNLLVKNTVTADSYTFEYSEHFPGCAVGEFCGNQGLPEDLGVTKSRLFATLETSDSAFDMCTGATTIREVSCTNMYNPKIVELNCPEALVCSEGACVLPSTVCGGAWRGFNSAFEQASQENVFFKFNAGAFKAADVKCAGGYVPLTMTSGTNYLATTNQNDEAVHLNSFNLCVERGMRPFSFWQFSRDMYFVSAFSCQRAANSFEFKLVSKKVSPTCSGPSLNQLNTAVNGNTKFRYDSGTGYYLTFFHPDVCSGNSVTEKYCDGNSIKDKTTVCPVGTLCSDGACVQAAEVECQVTRDCQMNFRVCLNGKCEARGVVACVDDSACSGITVCHGDGFCSMLCRDSSNCAEGFFCDQEGRCIDHQLQCQIDSDCPENGQVCQNNQCVLPGAVQCQNNNDCDDDEKCDNGICVVDPNKISYCQGNELGVGDPLNVGDYSFLFSTILPGVDCNKAKIKIYQNGVLKDTITECPKDGIYTTSINGDNIAMRMCRVDNANDMGVFQFSVNGQGLLVSTCEDTDSGMDLYKKGVTTYGVKDLNGAFIDTSTVRDACVDAVSVRKYYCDPLNTAKSTVVQCPNDGVCNDGVCSIGKKQINVTFEKGWNLFSVPLDKTTKSVSSCGQMDLWTYDNSLSKYVQVDSMLSGKSYWGYVSSKCQMTFEGEGLNINGLQLKKGWNQIPSSFVQQKLDDLLLLCNVAHGPWTYDTLQNTYILAQNSVPGKGYFVKVGADCKLEG